LTIGLFWVKMQKVGVFSNFKLYIMLFSILIIFLYGAFLYKL